MNRGRLTERKAGVLNEKHKLTSLAEEPDTSIHVLEKKAHEPSMKMM